MTYELNLNYIISDYFTPISDIILNDLSLLDLYNLYIALLKKDINNNIIKNKEIVRKISKHLVKYDNFLKQNNLELKNALFSNDVDLVCYSILRGMNVNTYDGDSNTPLINTAKFGFLDFNTSFDVIELLIMFGADVNWQNEKKNSALINAVLSSNYKVAKILLEANADVNIQNYNGETPLILVSGMGQFFEKNILKLLLEYKANINITTYKGRTALMYASINHFYENAKLLLKNGANVNIKDDLTYSALCYANNYIVKHREGYNELRSLFFPCTYICRLFYINFDSPYALRNKFLTINILENYQLYQI